MPITICTFNVNNLYTRYRFGKTYPGDLAKKSGVADPEVGYLPKNKKQFFEIFNPVQRKLAAQAITDDGKRYPHVICLQEVESLLTLRKFNEEFLDEHYHFSLLIDSRDFRQIDVGILSQIEIQSARTHVDYPDPEPSTPKPPSPPKIPRLFSRDCLEVNIALNKSGSRVFTLFINHLKSKFIYTSKATTPSEEQKQRKEDNDLRTRQADAVGKIVHSRFPGSKFDQAFFAVVGDLNDEPDSAPVQPLVKKAELFDVLARIPKIEDRWTHWFRSKNVVSQFDYVLLSPALNEATSGVKPLIERRGIGFSRFLEDGGTGPKFTKFHRLDSDPKPSPVNFQFQRFPKVTPEDNASDHCPVFMLVP